MRSASRRFGCVLLAVALGACTQAPPPGPSFTAADVAAIDSTFQAALAIANGSKDYPAYVQTYYAPDATVLPPNQAAIKGHAAIVEFLSSFPPISSFNGSNLSVEGAGDLAYAYGTYQMTMDLPAGPASDNGKYIEVWKRQADGTWKVQYDCFNSDLPATSEN